MDFSLLHMWTQMGMVAKGVVVILLSMSVYSITVSVERGMATPARSKMPSCRYSGW